jgi:hypothetical protein
MLSEFIQSFDGWLQTSFFENTGEICERTHVQSDARCKSEGVRREEHTAPPETARRAQAVNREPKWSSDPVLARGSVISLRNIRDTEGRREVCVNADPTTDQNDKLGACPTHASILRADPPLDVTQRLSCRCSELN